MKKICELNDKIILGQDGKPDSDEVRSIMAMCPERSAYLKNLVYMACSIIPYTRSKTK